MEIPCGALYSADATSLIAGARIFVMADYLKVAWFLLQGQTQAGPSDAETNNADDRLGHKDSPNNQ
jgi:hypothetical protein